MANFFVRYFHGFRYLMANDWGWVAAKVVGGIMMPLVVLDSISQSTAVRSGTISAFILTTLMYVMLAGGVLSFAGITARATRVRPLIVGYAIEIGGLVCLISSPMLLAIIYFATAIANGTGWTGPILCLSLAALFAARAIDIYVHHIMPKKEREGAVAKLLRRRKQEGA